MKTVKLIIMLSLFIVSTGFSQLIKIEKPNMVSESDIYVDEKNVRYSNLIKIKFSTNIINLPKGQKLAKLTDIHDNHIRGLLNELEQKYGKFDLHKVVPYASWGDTLRINKRTKKQVVVKDRSQIFTLHFKELVPVDSVVTSLEKLPFIKYAEGPMQVILQVIPNDYYYSSGGGQWNLDNVEASKAWDISKGTSSVKISILDQFYYYGDVHDDLDGKVVNKEDPDFSGGHGRQVAGVAGAKTNNTIGVASLGWDL